MIRSLLPHLLIIVVASPLLLHSGSNFAHAALCCNRGTSLDNPGMSCADIIRRAPGCRGQSGYYWIENEYTGISQQVYCDMERLGGGWERVAHYDSKLANATCPGDTKGYNLGPHHLCTNNGTNITSVQYLPVVQRYSEVMGLMVGFASGDGDAFRPSGVSVQDLDGVYMEGLSLCLNDGSGALKHIFSVGTTDVKDISLPTNCYMFTGAAAPTPHVIGRDRYCAPLLPKQMMTLDGNLGPHVSPFGDRDSGICGVLPMLCRHPNRYFIKQLANTYGPSRTLIVRVISKGNIVIGLSYMDIYVR